MSDVVYPLDTTGLAASNLILNEPHTLTAINSSTYRLLIPTFAPFYVDNFALSHVSDVGVVTPLVEGEHFNFAMPYIAATRSIGKSLYGGVSIIDSLLDGYIRIDSYQTIGGDWVADTQYVATRLAEMIYNPRTTVWDIVTNKTDLFPPINHDEQLDYVMGHGDLIAALNKIVEAIVNGSSVTANELRLLFENYVFTPA